MKKFEDKRVEYDPIKNELLKRERGYCFEDIYKKIINKEYRIKENKSSNHKGQRMFLLKLENYPVVVPFAEDDEKIFLKTMFKNRDFKKEIENDEK